MNLHIVYFTLLYIFKSRFPFKSKIIKDAIKRSFHEDI